MCKNCLPFYFASTQASRTIKISNYLSVSCSLVIFYCKFVCINYCKFVYINYQNNIYTYIGIFRPLKNFIFCLLREYGCVFWVQMSLISGKSRLFLWERHAVPSPYRLSPLKIGQIEFLGASLNSRCPQAVDTCGRLSKPYKLMILKC